MSLLQNEDFVLLNLRTSYLSLIKDGVGERLINVNPGVLNDPGFRAAGWSVDASTIRRTYSPPIPTAIASEYFQAPARSGGLTPAVFEDEEEGGMVTGGGSNETPGVGPMARRRRRKEQQEEDDSSDLSDESDEERERAAQQIKFTKMPVRTRAGSSPLRQSPRDGPSVLLPSPSKSTHRRGSLGALEGIKPRKRRDTTTSSEMSSDNDLNPSFFKRKPFNTTKAGHLLSERIQEEEHNANGSMESESESDAGSEGTTLSSEFAEPADSTSLLGGVGNPLVSSSPVMEMRPPQPAHLSPKKSRPSPAVLQALPPSRPISMVQPTSALSEMIKARKKKPVSPFEAFANLSGKGVPNPLWIKIYAPSSEDPEDSYEMPLQRIGGENENGDRMPVTVGEAIGLSLWRYGEEGRKPSIPSDKMNVNWWTLRMVEDGEVDYDFPALQRTRPISDFTSNNNRGARGRSREKPYDEFALVQATEEQFQENEKLTPQYSTEAESAQEDSGELTPLAGPQQSPAAGGPPGGGPPSASHAPSPDPLRNAFARPPFGTGFTSLRSNTTTTPADAPVPTSHATPRTGAPKTLKIHYTDARALSQATTVDVTTDTYIAEVLESLCKKWNLDRAHHVLRVGGTNTIAPLDRTVESLGERSDLELIRKRFANDGFFGGSPASTSPNAPLLLTTDAPKKGKKGLIHPLAQDWIGSTANYKKYNVLRKQPMSFTPSHARILVLDGEYMHIMPGETGRTLFDAGGKTTTIHFSSVVGCKVSRRHPKTFRVVVFKERESKRYDFEAQNADEAAEIIAEIKKGLEPFQDNNFI